MCEVAELHSGFLARREAKGGNEDLEAETFERPDRSGLESPFRPKGRRFRGHFFS